MNSHILQSYSFTLTLTKGFFFPLPPITRKDFQEFRLLMSESPCRADLLASLEASGEKMQSSFSRSHTSLTKTRQTQNHIHVSDAAVTIKKSSPGVLSLLPGIFSSWSFLLNCKSCTFPKVKHTSFGSFPNILVYLPEEFFERPFFNENRSRDRQITRKH